MAAENIRVSSFEVLADELIDIILSYEFLDHRDLCCFAKTCARLKEIANYSELWKKKAFHRWKRWKTQSAEHWKDVYKDRHMAEKEIMLALDKLSVQCGSKAYVSRSQYKDALEYVATEKPYDEYLDCTLEELFYKNPEIPRNCNLTHKYYAEKMYDYSQKLVLTREWKMLMERPVEEQHLEDGALLIAKWTDIRKTSDLAQESLSMLDKMADRVKSIIQEQAPPQGCSSSRDPQMSMQILEAIKHVMYKEEKFVGNTQDYYNVDNSLITQVLKTKQGIPITLAVIFVAVARRLGVDIEPVNSRDHFLLRYCSNQNSRNIDPSERYTYIDAFDEGKFYSEEQCANHFFSGIASLMPTESLFPQASPKDVFIRMATNIARIYHCSGTITNAGLLALRNAYELRTLLQPSVPGLKLLIAQVDVHLDVDLDEAIRLLNEVLLVGHDVTVARNFLERAQEQKHQEESEKGKSVKQKLKSDRLNNLVEYSVGMAMRHRRYHYGCVIYGWDHFCDMDESWIIQMGVDQLPLGGSQPFYNVLGNDGSSRYAAQENLSVEPCQPFNPHPEIGKYFKSWTGTRYIPNEYLSQRYPEDYQVDLDKGIE